MSDERNYRMELEDAVTAAMDADCDAETVRETVEGAIEAWIADNVDTTPIDYGPRKDRA